MKLENKVVAITGAAGGMGKAISSLFAKEGADIAAIDIRPEKFNETMNNIKLLGRKAETYKLDVTVEEDVNKCFKKITRTKEFMIVSRP